MNSSDRQPSNPHSQRLDQAIDATLAVLRESALPPSGLEQRVLQNLAERTATAPRERWRFAWFAVPLTVCAVLAILCLALLRHTQPTPRPMAENAPSTSGSAPVIAPRPAVQLVAHDVPNRQPRKAHAHRLAGVRESSALVAHAEAPPMPAPLTEQERLLLQIAVSGDSAQRAMLNPEVLARKESEDDAEFRNFFAKTPNAFRQGIFNPLAHPEITP